MTIKPAPLPVTNTPSASIGENNTGIIIYLSFFDGNPSAVKGKTTIKSE
jgi:hypothetical protein